MMYKHILPELVECRAKRSLAKGSKVLTTTTWVVGIAIVVVEFSNALLETASGSPMAFETTTRVYPCTLGT